MVEQNTEVAPEQDQPIEADPAHSGDGNDIDATAADAEDDDFIDDLEFLIDDIEDQIAPLGL